MNKLILFNGPPRSGKDTAVDYLEENYSVYGLKFASPLHRAARETITDLVGYEKCKHYSEDAKNDVIPELGSSYRNFCIWLSENFYKPNFGSDIFGRMAAGRVKDRIASHNRFDTEIHFACSDSGFAAEAKPVIDVIGAENVMLVQLYREGCSFAGDSRNYIDLSEFGIQPWKVINTDIDGYYKTLDYLYEQLTAPCLPAPQVL